MGAISTTSGNPLHILLVENEPADAELVKVALQAVEDHSFELRVAASMSEVDSDDQPTDLLLVDLGLPDCKGVETVTRAKEQMPNVPLIVLTGNESTDVALACVDAGAEDFLEKPSLSPITLRRAIGFALSRQREARIKMLEQTLLRFSELSTSGAKTSVTRSLTNASAIKQRAPREYEELCKEYKPLLESYVEQVICDKPKPTKRMAELAATIGDLSGGPRDLIDVHVNALRAATAGRKSARVRAFGVDGRLLALEMMGLLVDYYRIGIRRSRVKGKP
ncbi:MAG: response regulator transcription factor [Polyangiales bacterium]